MVRSYLGTCGAVAGAGILALGLVVVTTSEAHAARIDMRAVRVASVALPSTPPLGLQVVTIRAADQTAAPTDPVTFLTENAQILADGIGQSADRAAVAVVGEAVLPFVTAFLAVASPARIPTILLLTQESSESIWTGALNTKFGIGYDEFVPGFYIPADVKPTGNPGDAHDYALRRIVGALVPSSNVRTAADNQASFATDAPSSDPRTATVPRLRAPRTRPGRSRYAMQSPRWARTSATPPPRFATISRRRWASKVTAVRQVSWEPDACRVSRRAPTIRKAGSRRPSLPVR